jgi:hypothetical protein
VREDGGFSHMDAAPVRAAVTDAFTHYQRLFPKRFRILSDVKYCRYSTHKFMND